MGFGYSPVEIKCNQRGYTQLVSKGLMMGLKVLIN